MSRTYGEPVNVQAREDGRPARFVWRGRLYTVRAIEEHWIITRERQQDPGSSAAGPGSAGAEPGSAGAESGSAGADPGSSAADPGRPDVEFWRVHASPGTGVTPVICELRREAATNTWTLRPGQR